MGTNTLPKLGTGATVDKDSVNSIIDALNGHFVPRDASGNLSDGTQNLGAPNAQWGDLFIKGRLVRNGRSLLGDEAGLLRGSYGSLFPGIQSRLAEGFVRSGRTTNGEDSFLVPGTLQAGGSGVIVFGSAATPLRLRFKDGTQLSITSPLGVRLLQTRQEGSSYTASTNIRVAADGEERIQREYFGLRAMGYFGTRTPLQGGGGGITSSTTSLFAFSTDEDGSDCGLCQIVYDGEEYHVTHAWKGFFGRRGAAEGEYLPGENTSHTSNITLHFAGINHIFVSKNSSNILTAFAYKKDPKYAPTDGMYQLDDPEGGDIRLNERARQWEIYNSTSEAWEELDAVYLGMAVPSPDGGCNFARSVCSEATMREMAAAPFFSGGTWTLDPSQQDAIVWLPNTSPMENVRASGRAWRLDNITVSGRVFTYVGAQTIGTTVQGDFAPGDESLFSFVIDRYTDAEESGLVRLRAVDSAGNDLGPPLLSYDSTNEEEITTFPESFVRVQENGGGESS